MKFLRAESHKTQQLISLQGKDTEEQRRYCVTHR